ncbi:MAG TPA: UDP-3-O-(3-hydroxymyristoyl)glucosamine N-acyltransferase [Acidobacteriaceae bacterium]|jgi:UDP-3-O-[3-hydroxymyristoyl] glucosamine N-acyltransferase|nr:UDP-3-O-(3-hydroxymyristoyl)glucosamine N-acyltransferase [Acidobacteriaceae bacterium]
MKLSQIAAALGAELRLVGPDPKFDPEISGVASAGTASPASLVFAEDAAALSAAIASPAAAVIVASKMSDAVSGKTLLVVAQPRLAFAQAARLLRPAEPVSDIHASAVIDASATLGQNVSVGPCAVIEANAQIGAGTTIGAGSVIGRDVKIGDNCRIYPRVVVYPGTELGNNVVLHAGVVLGSDGFGYVRNAATGEYLQSPQQGRLVIEDDVEIGANTTIDRGALEETRIERGVKIDNLVHLGHNVRVGHDVVIAAQTGVSGSSTIGANAIVGGQVGIGDHAHIGEQVILGSGSGVLTSKKVKGPGVVFWGRPARPLRQYLKELAALARLARASDDQEEP